MAAKTNKYSETMVNAIMKASADNGGLDLELCNSLAEGEDFRKAGITGRGIVAKARTLGLPYRKVERLTKAGAPVMRKDELVQEIENALGISGLDSLSKADKEALRKLADAVKPEPVYAAAFA